MTRIKDLPTVAGTSSADVTFVVSDPTEQRMSKITMEQVLSSVIKKIGYPEKVLEKCPACGQWGAVMCECPKCGHPIDPK